MDVPLYECAIPSTPDPKPLTPTTMEHSIQPLLILNVAATTTFAATANSSLKPFYLPSIDAHQPHGNPGGQVNYYHLVF